MIRLLERASLDYQSLFLDNISNLVLLIVLGCVIADQPVHELKLNTNDCIEIENYFKGDDLGQIKKKVKSLLTLVYHKLNIEDMQQIIESISEEYATRIFYGIQNQAIHGVFYLSSPNVI